MAASSGAPTWAYEELGWGGYWSWDPVENGSLIPWLTGTALVHGLTIWRCHGALKKTTLCLAITTFALCNFATFLTRSGVFSSLHAFSQSPIGWMFLVWIVVLTAGQAVLIFRRRAALAAERPLTSVWSREAFVLIGVWRWSCWRPWPSWAPWPSPLSGIFSKAKIVVGVAFYNDVLIPVGLILLTAMAAIPLLRWVTGRPPRKKNAGAGRRRRGDCRRCGLRGRGAASPCPGRGGLGRLDRRLHRRGFAPRRPGTVLAKVLASFARVPGREPPAICRLSDAPRRRLPGDRRGGVRPGKSAAQRRHGAGRDGPMGGTVRAIFGLDECNLPDKIVVEARLEVSEGGVPTYPLLPAETLYRLQNQWSSQVAIHSAWSGDFYTILHGGNASDKVNLTLIDNPLMRWLWSAGWISVAGRWPRCGRSSNGRAGRPTPKYARCIRSDARADSPRQVRE